jgi:hypothetical protein
MSNARKITLDKDKILNQIEALASIAKKNSWQYNYDPDVDELVFGKVIMPRDSFLFNVSDELNLFLSPDSTVYGVFIEYFGANYVEHNKELKTVLSILEEEAEDIAPKEDTKIIEQEKKALEIELLADAFKSVFAKDQLVTAI